MEHSKVADAVEDILVRKNQVDDFMVEADFPGIGRAHDAPGRPQSCDRSRKQKTDPAGHQGHGGMSVEWMHPAARSANCVCIVPQDGDTDGAATGICNAMPARTRFGYGVRRQSEAATALFQRVTISHPRKMLPPRKSGVALRLPPHSKSRRRAWRSVRGLSGSVPSPWVEGGDAGKNPAGVTECKVRSI